MDLAFEVWGCGGIVARSLVLGPPFGQLHSSCCFPLLPLHSSLGDLYSEPLPHFLEAVLLKATVCFALVVLFLFVFYLAVVGLSSSM